MLLSAFLIVWTLQSDSWWRKLLHFIFIISNNHFFFMSIIYNPQTACCVMKFKAVYRLKGSHYLFTYIYIYLCGCWFSTTGKQVWWMYGCSPTGTCGSLQNWTVVRQLPALLWSLEGLSRAMFFFFTVEPLHHLSMLNWQIKTQYFLQSNVRGILLCQCQGMQMV